MKLYVLSQLQGTSKDIATETTTIKVDMLVKIDFIPQYPLAYTELLPSFYRVSIVQMQIRTEQCLRQQSQIDFLG